MHPGTVSSRFLSPARVRRTSRALLLVLALLALAPPAYLLQTGGAMSTGYEIQKLEKERTAWMNRNQQLEVEIARARSLIWVEHEAVHRLGMQRPPQSIVIKIDSIPAAQEPRLLRRGGEAMPAQPVEEGPSWIDAVTSVATSLATGE